jgi:hypothetical protein
MDMEPVTDLGPPLTIGLILIAVGLTLPVIGIVWCAMWWCRWARDRIKKAPPKQGKESPGGDGR